MLATETTMFCRRVNAFTEQLRESRDGAALSFQEDNSPTNQADGAQLELEGVSSQQTLSKAFSLSHLARVLVEDSRAAMASAHQTFAHTRAVVQQTEEIFQQLRASRERYTELRAQIGDISHLADSTLQDDHSPSTDASSCDPSGINKED